jgi:hypothetical protein
MRELFLLVLVGCGGAPKDADDGGDRGGTPEPDVVGEPNPRGEQSPTGPYDGAGGQIVWPPEVELRVCADGSEAFTDIQAAIDSSEYSTVIGVCPGTYGPISLSLRQDLEIVGVGGPEVTVIDGGDDTAVYVEDAVLDLHGFTVTGTGVSFEWETDHGGAFTVRESDVTVRDTIVTGVTGPYSLVFDENVLLMEDVVWEDNTNTMLWDLFQGDTATFRRNVIRGGTFQHLVLTERVDVLDVRQTLFTGVTIDTGFSAFMLPTDGTGPFTLANNVFHDIDDLDPFGGRLFDLPDVDFRNNIVYDSESWDLRRFRSSYSLFYENGVDYEPKLVGRGNLFVDPMFTDARNGDFTLKPGSPAIDAGDPASDFNDADGTRNDLGIYGGT